MVDMSPEDLMLQTALDVVIDPERWAPGVFVLDARGKPVPPSSPSAEKFNLDGALFCAQRALGLSPWVYQDVVQRLHASMTRLGWHRDFYQIQNPETGHANTVRLLEETLHPTVKKEAAPPKLEKPASNPEPMVVGHALPVQEGANQRLSYGCMVAFCTMAFDTLSPSLRQSFMQAHDLQSGTAAQLAKLADLLLAAALRRATSATARAFSTSRFRSLVFDAVLHAVETKKLPTEALVLKWMDAWLASGVARD